MSAIPFVIVNDEEKYEVTKSALAFLSTIRTDQPLGIISIAGKYRTGKSLFCNRVLLDEEPGKGFGVGSSIQACTKGIWIYTKTIEKQLNDGTVMNVLVMDSEGIGSLDADDTHDCKIFALTLLLSSFFVYNSVGSIDEPAIQNLSLVANVGKQIRIHGDKDASASDLAEVFPSFCWIVRDFTLRLLDKNGNDINSNQYLENALTGDNSDSVKSVLRECFPTRQCMTLVRPCQEENDLQILDKIPEKKLRYEFVKQMRSIRTQIFSSLKPKTLLGSPVSGNMLGSLAKSLVESINQGAAPVLKDSWAMLQEIQAVEASQEAVEFFDSSFCNYQKSGKIQGPEDFTRLMETWVSEAFKIFEKKVSGGDILKEKVNKKLDSKKSDFWNQNQSLIRRCMEGAMTMIGDSLDDIDTVTDLKKLFKERDNQILSKFGSSVSLVALWSTVKLPFVWKWILKISKNQEILVQKIDSANTELETSVRELTQKIDDGIQEYKKLTDDYEKKIMHMEDEHESTINSNEKGYTEQLQTMICKVEMLQKELSDLTEKLTCVTNESNHVVDTKDYQIEESKREFVELEGRYKNSLMEIETLTEMLEDIKKSSSRDGSLMLQIEEYKMNISNTKEKVEYLQIQCKNNDQKFKNHIEEINADSIKFIQKAKAEKQSLEKEKRDLQSSFESLREDNVVREQTLQKNLSFLNRQIVTNSEKLAKVSDNLKRSQESEKVLEEKFKVDQALHFETLQTSKKVYIEEIRIKDDEFKSLSTKLEEERQLSSDNFRTLEKKCTNTVSDLNSSKRKIEELTTESESNKRLKLEVHYATSELEKCRGITKWLESDKVTKESRISDLTKQMSSLEKRCSEIQRQNDVNLLKMKMAYENYETNVL
jgi:hypothetical protein